MQGEQPDFRRHVLLGVWLSLNCKIEIIALYLIAPYLIPNIRRTSGFFFSTLREIRTESPLTRAFLFWGHPLDSCGEAEGKAQPEVQSPCHMSVTSTIESELWFFILGSSVFTVDFHSSINHWSAAMERVRKTFFDPLAISKTQIREVLEDLPTGSAHPFTTASTKLISHPIRKTSFSMPWIWARWGRFFWGEWLVSSLIWVCNLLFQF
jgi:hypothetical protein